MRRFHALYCALLWGLLACAAGLWADPGEPGPATVHIARSERIFVPQGIFAPRLLYPRGRLDLQVLQRLVDAVIASVTGATGGESWRRLVGPDDRIGLLIETYRYPVQAGTVEIVIDRLVNIGIPPEHIIVFSGDEGDLFAAGFNINRQPPGVRVLGAETEGYRGGMSRIVLDYCDVLINIGALRADPELGMAGCLANTLACVPHAKRVALRKDPGSMPAVAAHPALRNKLRLNILEAYLPLLDVVGGARLTYEYRGLLASTDIVAIDVIGRKILSACRKAHRGEDWPLAEAPDYLQIAYERYRLGQAQPAQIQIKLQGDKTNSFLEDAVTP